MTGYNAISFVIQGICVQVEEGEVGRHSLQQVEEGYEGFVVMLVLRLLLLTLGYSQLQILHDVRNKHFAQRTNYLGQLREQGLLFLVQVGQCYADLGFLRPLLSSGVSTRSK